LHKITNKSIEQLRFMDISKPKAHSDRIEIINYSETLKHHIKELNVEWLTKYFKVEKGDVVSLSDPIGEIINKGGFIFYARLNNKIVGTVSLLKVTDQVFELAKMAVTDSVQGLGIGNLLMQHSFSVAKQNAITKLILHSNRSLHSAIHLYRKYGFREVELVAAPYERANIKMEKYLINL
jgi:ribosomal protein S18 acetylase RimI-like enzyme